MLIIERKAMDYNNQTSRMTLRFITANIKAHHWRVR